MSFIDHIEKEVENLKQEILKVREARGDKVHHANFISEKINSLIRNLAKENPDEPTRALGEALSKVYDMAIESFDHLEKIETNIIVTINAYNKLKDDYIAHENRKKQEESIAQEVERKTRKAGERPQDKLSERKEKPKKASAKKTSSRKSSTKKSSSKKKKG